MAVPDAQASDIFLLNSGQIFPLEISSVLLIIIVGISLKTSIN
jgi:hypothetical protein